MKNGKINKKPFLTQQQQRLAIYVVGALLLWAMMSIMTWHLASVKNKENYEAKVTQLVEIKKQSVAEYQESTLREIKQYTKKDSTRSLFLGGANDDAVVLLQQRIQSAIQNAKVVHFYYPGQAQQEKNVGGAIGFVVLDMINRVERSQTVYPEVSKVKSSPNWLIHWVVPIYKDNSSVVATEDKTLLAVLYVSTTTNGLRQQLMSESDGDVGYLQVMQKIDRQKSLAFLSIGSANTHDIRLAEVADSHWQIAFSPSSYFISQAMPTSVWFIVFALISLVGVVIAALAKCKNDFTPIVQPDDASLPAIVKEDVVDEPDDDDFQGGLNDPIYLVEVQQNIEESGMGENQDDGQLITGSESLILSDSAVPESVSVAPHIFRAYDIRGVVDRDLNTDTAEVIGKVVASEAIESGEKALIVGHDSRSHSPELYENLIKGILSTGCDVIQIGLVPTPLMNFATVFSDQTGSGVIVTASHNPKEYNGFKIVINEKTLVDTDIQRLRERIEVCAFVESGTQGRTIQMQFQEDYIDAITADIAINADIRIVIDAANGAAGQLAPALFEELGCQVTPLFCDFDGSFPNHDPDPTVKTNLQPLIQRVQAEKADLGIALDGDGDRLVVVTSSGKIVWPDRLLMLFARDVVSRNPGCDVIFDVKSTRQLTPLISGYGGRPIMWKTGHAHMKAKMRETGALLAGEFSGHIFFKERWFGFDDGLYAAARLLEIISLRDQSVDNMLASMADNFSTPEIKIPVPEEHKFELIEQLIASGDFASGEKTTIDGLRVDFAKGWGLVRASNTSPSLTLRFEADNENGVNQLKTLFKRELQKIDAALDLNF